MACPASDWRKEFGRRHAAADDRGRAFDWIWCDQVTLAARRTKSVNSLEGSLWLTQQGDARDIVLEAGEIARIEHGGLTIVSALSDARFVLLHDDDAPPQWAWRIRATQAALAAY